MRILPSTDISNVIAKFHELEIQDVLITGGEIRWARDILADIFHQLNNVNITYSASTAFIYDADFIDFLIEQKPRAIMDPENWT